MENPTAEKTVRINSKMGIASIRVAMKRLLRGQGGRAAWNFANKASDYHCNGSCVICGDSLPRRDAAATTCDECRRVIGEAVMMRDFNP